MATSTLGAGHCRATTHGPREPQVHLRRRRVFYKWIEARAVSTITSKTAQKCRFGVPSELTVDNGKQFDNQDFRDFCFSIGTKLAFASVYHPQSNGVVERANSKIFTAIKKRFLDDRKGKWADQVPKVV
jgi:IS30 family transposase